MKTLAYTVRERNTFLPLVDMGWTYWQLYDHSQVKAEGEDCQGETKAI